MLKPFLTANWRYLAMLDFAVDPKILAPHVPAGTELDFHNDKKPTSASSASSSITPTSARSTVTDRVLYRLVENPTPIQPDGK
jgi:uncharacterized protein YqjF (DUF2071 family)